MQPKSHTINSLRSTTRSLGLACGFAPFGPDEGMAFGRQSHDYRNDRGES